MNALPGDPYLAPGVSQRDLDGDSDAPCCATWPDCDCDARAAAEEKWEREQER